MSPEKKSEPNPAPKKTVPLFVTNGKKVTLAGQRTRIVTNTNTNASEGVHFTSRARITESQRDPKDKK